MSRHPTDMSNPSPRPKRKPKIPPEQIDRERKAREFIEAFKKEIAPKENPKCVSCGVPWSDHLGMTGTCAKLEKARDTLRIIRDVSDKNSAFRQLCDKTLESIK